MKGILRSVLVLLLSVVMCLSWINFRPVKGDSNIDILIYVDEAIYGDVDVKQAIDTYAADIQSEGWTNLTIFTDAAALAPEDVRYIITLCWMWYHIKGCLLIGDFPSAMWENGTSFPTDYYMDLNGTWTDTDNPPNGMYDSHTGHIRPEIWVARLMTSTVDDGVHDEKGFYLAYFDKNHETRSPSSRILHTPATALAYIDNEPAFGGNPANESSQAYNPIYVNDTVTALEKAYANVTLVSSPIPNATNTNAQDYETRLTAETLYEWVWLTVHGGTNFHAWGRYYWYDGLWRWGFGMGDGRTYSDFYLHDSPKPFFYIISSCYSNRFDLTNSVAMQRC